jgi:O-antigen/teichoic acid export membrane protein
MSNKPLTDPQKFAGYIVWAAVSGLIVPFVGLVTLPALTRGYSAAIYAVWIQSVFVVGLLSFTLNLCLGYAVVTFLAGEDDSRVRRHALGAMLWPTLLFSGLAIIISLVFGPSVSGLMFASPDYVYLVPFVFLWAVLESMFLLLTSYLQARRRIKGLSVTQICLALYKVVVIIVLAASGIGLEWIMGAIVAGELVLVLILLAIIVREIGWPMPSLIGLKDYLAFSLPLIPSAVLFWAISASDRFFIVYLMDLSQAGIYSASFFMGNLISLFYGPIQVALFPVISRLWEQNDRVRVRNYLKYSNKLFLAIAIPGAAGLYIVSQPVLAILATPGYISGSGLVLVIAIACVLLGLYQINAYVILLMQQTKWLTPLIAVAAAVTVAGNLVFIPAIGIMGAAVSVMLANLVLAVTAIAWAQKVVGTILDIWFLAKAVTGAALMAWCVSIIPVGGIPGLIVMLIAGIILFGLWMWLTRAFSKDDINVAKDIITGIKQGKLLK